MPLVDCAIDKNFLRSIQRTPAIPRFATAPSTLSSPSCARRSNRGGIPPGPPDRETGSILGTTLLGVLPGLFGPSYLREIRRAMDERIAIRLDAVRTDHGRWLESHLVPIDEGIAMFLSDGHSQGESRTRARGRGARDVAHDPRSLGRREHVHAPRAPCANAGDGLRSSRVSPVSRCGAPASQLRAQRRKRAQELESFAAESSRRACTTKRSGAGPIAWKG